MPTYQDTNRDPNKRDPTTHRYTPPPPENSSGHIAPDKTPNVSQERERDMEFLMDTLLNDLPNNPNLREKLRSLIQPTQGQDAPHAPNDPLNKTDNAAKQSIKLSYAGAVKTPPKQTKPTSQPHTTSDHSSSPFQRDLDMTQTTESLWRLARSSHLLSEQGPCQNGLHRGPRRGTDPREVGDR